MISLVLAVGAVAVLATDRGSSRPAIKNLYRAVLVVALGALVWLGRDAAHAFVATGRFRTTPDALALAATAFLGAAAIFGCGALERLIDVARRVATLERWQPRLAWFRARHLGFAGAACAAGVATFVLAHV